MNNNVYPAYCEFEFDARSGEQQKTVIVPGAKWQFEMRSIIAGGFDPEAAIRIDIDGVALSETALPVIAFSKFPFPIIPAYRCTPKAKITIIVNQKIAIAGLIRIDGVKGKV